MSSWNSTGKAGYVKGSNDASTILNDTISNRTRTASEGPGLTSSGNYSVVGIKVEAIEGMRDALRTYVQKIQDHLDTVSTSLDTSNAFRSYDASLESAVNNYINNVQQYCKNLTSNLLFFSDRLAFVSAMWLAQTKTTAGVITEDIETKSTGTAYKDELTMNLENY